MGQRRITIEVTETQARTIRWALERASMFVPSLDQQKRLGRRLFYRKLDEALKIVQEAAHGLSEVHTYPVHRHIKIKR